MKVGDLVRYHHRGIASGRIYSGIDIGIIVMVDFNHVYSPVPYKVRWADHSNSERDWFREDELVKL